MGNFMVSGEVGISTSTICTNPLPHSVLFQLLLSESSVPSMHCSLMVILAKILFPNRKYNNGNNCINQGQVGSNTFLTLRVNKQNFTYLTKESCRSAVSTV